MLLLVTSLLCLDVIQAQSSDKIHIDLEEGQLWSGRVLHNFWIDILKWIASNTQWLFTLVRSMSQLHL